MRKPEARLVAYLTVLALLAAMLVWGIANSAS
ncbi:hypothetical protein GA0115245_112583 [Streptomyces sp. di188]|nr:hypothetical protein GA0115238_120084 [Streptomyces sp. di50b]SCD75856.1 hypothetical protein GA0115245_112583 [Streptomyces sp. di188]